MTPFRPRSRKMRPTPGLLVPSCRVQHDTSISSFLRGLQKSRGKRSQAGSRNKYDKIGQIGRRTGAVVSCQAIMQLALDRCTLRPWQDGDQPSLVRHANNPNVARHLRERFPQPYTLANAEAWMAAAA